MQRRCGEVSPPAVGHRARRIEEQLGLGAALAGSNPSRSMRSTVRSRWMDGIRPGGDVRQDGPNCWAVRQLLGRAQAGERSHIRCWTGSAAREQAELSRCKRAEQLAAEPSVRAKLGRKTGHSRREAIELSRANASLFISIQFEPMGELF